MTHIMLFVDSADLSVSLISSLFKSLFHSSFKNSKVQYTVQCTKQATQPPPDLSVLSWPSPLENEGGEGSKVQRTVSHFILRVAARVLS